MTNTELSLKATVREELGKKIKDLRKQGKIPAVLYGHKIKPVSLSINYLDFEKLHKKAGDNTLVDLLVNEDKSVKVLIQDYQSDPVSNNFIHVDFHQVDMDEKIHTEIPLKFIGEAPAVKELSGVLIHGIDSINVECLPGDLIKEIEVDLSGIKTFDDIIHVENLNIPSTLTVLNKPEDVIAQVQPPRSDKEFEATAAPVEAPSVPAEASEAKEESGDSDSGDEGK